VLLLMKRLDRPLGAREIAEILGLNEHTVARQLQGLARLNLVARTAHRQGYIPLGGRQRILGETRNVKNAQFEPTTTTINYIVESQEIEAVVVVDPPRTVKNARLLAPNVKNARLLEASQGELAPLARALQEAGIGEPKRSALARLPGLTPESVKAWESHLKVAKGPRYTPGLLIHMLESGEPSPPSRPNGHAEICNCDECQILRYRRCPYCGAYDCDCV
jgi:hypothetical protein